MMRHFKDDAPERFLDALNIIDREGRPTGGRIGRTRSKLAAAIAKKSNFDGQRAVQSLLADLCRSMADLVAADRDESVEAPLAPMVDVIVDQLDALMWLATHYKMADALSEPWLPRVKNINPTENFMKSLNYWHMQMHPNDKSFAEEHVHAILEHKRIIGLGDWDAGEGTIRAFREDVAVNDVVAIKNGGRLIALVQVIGGWYEVLDDDSEIGWIECRRPVRLLDWAIEDKFLPQPRGTLERCVSDVETTRIIKKWFDDVGGSFEKRGLPLYV